jgi:hypothetical protein
MKERFASDFATFLWQARTSQNDRFHRMTPLHIKLKLEKAREKVTPTR